MNLGPKLTFAAILICLHLSAAAVAAPEPESSPSGYPYAQITEDSNKNNPLVPYRERRSTWGALLSVSYSNYTPADYQPDFVTSEDYSQFYAETDTPLFEFTISPKLNIWFFSVTADVGAGFFENKGKYESSLILTPVRVGGTLALDAMFEEPYFVPYVSAGLYTVFYRETLASQKVEGRTTPAPYWAAGAKFQLDWIDPKTDDEGLLDFGLENTFLFVEARSFLPSGDRVPDLSSAEEYPVMVNAGFSLEF